MEDNNMLSIVIPTWNRSEFLDRCIELIYPSIEENAIRVHVQDNASIDKTSDVAAKWMDRSGLISYERNEENVGPDRNFELALKATESEYVWLLGDTYTIPKDAITHVLTLIRTRVIDLSDAIVVNANGRIKNIQFRAYGCSQQLFSDLGWHTTLLSSLIYSRKLIESADFQRYHDTNFIHTGILFEALSEKDKVNVVWVPEISIENIKVNGVVKKSWENEAIEIWLERWPAFVLSLPPSYPLKEKLKIIKDHNIRTNVFGFNLLYYLKRNNVQTIKRLVNLGELRVLAMPRWLLAKAFLVEATPEFIFIFTNYIRDRLCLLGCYSGELRK